MVRSTLRRLAGLGIALALLAGCSAASPSAATLSGGNPPTAAATTAAPTSTTAATDTAVPSATASATNTPLPTAAASSTPTRTATSLPTLVATATLRPTVIPSPANVQPATEVPFEQRIGACGTGPAMNADGTPVDLDASQWYAIEKYVNAPNSGAPTYTHTFTAQQGGRVYAEPESAELVNAGMRPHASPSGARAWGPCLNHLTAQVEAERAAKSYKAANPGHIVVLIDVNGNAITLP